MLLLLLLLPLMRLPLEPKKPLEVLVEGLEEEGAEEEEEEVVVAVEGYMRR
jgi:hypothetical protein